MYPSMSIEYAFADSETTLRLIGVIDASITPILTSALTNVRHRRLTLDCAKVGRVEAAGIKPWMETLDHLKSSYTLKLERCSETFIDIAQMVPRFTREIPIRSFYSTLYCQPCDIKELVLIELIDDHAIPDENATCSSCGKAFAQL